jgi:hypothetical protein
MLIPSSPASGQMALTIFITDENAREISFLFRKSPDS